MGTWARVYLVSLIVFGVLDGLWLGVVAAPLYDDQLGPLLAEQPQAWAAVVFYLFFLTGLCWFVIRPNRDSVGRAARDGAFFGAIAYATWDLTNAAVLADWPLLVVPIDIAWGAVLCSATAAATVRLTRGRLAADASPTGHGAATA